MSHYFMGDDTEHDYREIEFGMGGRTYRFKTDRGVFSRDKVDFGSSLLIETVIKDKAAFQASGNFIDMGAGYGPIGITLGDILDMKPVMVEVNEDAVVICRENAEKNDVEAVVMARMEYDSSETPEADLYVTNPPFRAGKPVVLDIIKDAHHVLPAGGVFYMVVQKKQGMPSYKKAVASIFGDAESVGHAKGYHVLKGIKNCQGKKLT
ncbi:class I SAM-dependent methyltransferase [Salinicoccus albus]|uniref:class I SAM-dependent methyltransferase n=1 Tax=Salinicoccus albus TaxID=418756 RepID=UPI00035D24AD|nr:methyltransferase [Salinicoccus albus]